jgi:transcription antitermination factor NusG
MYRLSKQEHEFRERMRGKYPEGLNWYAVMMHSGRERRVRERILFDCSDRGAVEVLLPERKGGATGRQGKRTPPGLLFPCYVFLRCRMDDEIYMRISAYEDVFQVLGRAYRIPSVIDDAEIAHLKGVLMSEPRPEMMSRLNVGDQAVVIQGMMEGMRGRVLEFNARFVKLETCFSFLDNGTSIAVHVPRAHVRLEK